MPSNESDEPDAAPPSLDTSRTIVVLQSGHHVDFAEDLPNKVASSMLASIPSMDLESHPIRFANPDSAKRQHALEQ